MRQFLGGENRPLHGVKQDYRLQVSGVRCQEFETWDPAMSKQ